MSVNPFTQGADDEIDVNPYALQGSPQDVKNAKALYESTDATSIMRAYVEDDIPIEFKQQTWYKEFWSYLSKNITYSFLTDDDVGTFDTYFHISKMRFLMSRPPDEITNNDLMMLDQMRSYLRAKIKRAVGFATYRINERTQSGSQTNQIVRSNTESLSTSQPSSGGIFSGFKSLFGGKK